MIALLALLASSSSAADKWIRLATPHFELYTAVGEKKGREVILYFEQVRGFFSKVLASKKASETPVRLVVFRSESQFRPYAPNSVAAAYFAPGRYRDYIVMEDAAPEHLPIAIHEYMHLVIEHSGLRVPLWLNEGLADVFSTLRPVGDKVLVGDLIPGRLQVLQSEKWMSWEELTSVGHKSSAYNEKQRVGIFYAESWALVHMLYLAPEYRPKFSAFLSAVGRGNSPDDACRSSYGKSSAEVYADLRSYMSRNRLFGTLYNLNLAKSGEEATLSPVPPLDSDLVLADLLAIAGKRDQAAVAYRKLDAADPGNPEISRSMGYLAWQSDDPVGASAQFKKSFAVGSRDPEMCFHLAQLELVEDPTSPEAIAALERALEIRPDYTEARLQLGLALINLRRYANSLSELSKIHKVDDDHAASLFNALAFDYLQMGDRDEARKQANIALKWDRTDAEKRQTDEILRYLNGAPTAR